MYFACARSGTRNQETRENQSSVFFSFFFVFGLLTKEQKITRLRAKKNGLPVKVTVPARTKENFVFTNHQEIINKKKATE